MWISKEILIVIEMILIIMAIWRIVKFIGFFRQTSSSLNFEERVEESFKKQFKSKILVTLLTREVSIYYYLFTKQPAVDNGYTYYKKIGYGGIIGAFIGVMVLEGIGVSYFLHSWNKALAIIHLIMSIYLIVYLVADFKAIKRNPITLKDGKLRIKLGLRIKAEVDLNNIESISSSRIHYEEDKKKRDVLDLNLIGFDDPDFEIVLKEPVRIKDFIGREYPIKKIYLSIDEKENFSNECTRLIQSA
ncbi:MULTISPECIES: hypothetical protein [unclassified Bacillus (in: firmicutes)]|uniref:hypothetical protein n=1 Tax=unclassified Bacillus (in: firmicutes) TaxID=185979 RepID=UPI0008E3BA19|nr:MULTISPECIES: hypothetical protein [unclassified Bacillus (in: firmicutes)]SFA71366.1 hypothetical protein SAMN02799634_101204 [Bacillus sp. UNCCL13]SFQ61542.1 hypothetical protein SAMN04488577_0485 [Bacillus sp. cl95]